ncbi:hypothetical protein BKA91DRAFT_12492 [Yarrowia lipolytica]|nr:hypothetical protein BKA91DRAFT_12492 [Yarrowia lipolytica]KAE8171006.1 hypothetical protein BKA90DRAFT_31378 [Yarrowia lipolytica]RMI95026.1 hypothetical protein BD777DRAFT_16141 [Yarrowia lipolytica]
MAFFPFFPFFPLFSSFSLFFLTFFSLFFPLLLSHLLVDHCMVGRQWRYTCVTSQCRGQPRGNRSKFRLTPSPAPPLT